MGLLVRVGTGRKGSRVGIRLKKGGRHTWELMWDVSECSERLGLREQSSNSGEGLSSPGLGGGVGPLAPKPGMYGETVGSRTFPGGVVGGCNMIPRPGLWIIVTPRVSRTEGIIGGGYAWPNG